MLPSQYTSTYNTQFRDQQTHFIAPHAGESMYHFPSQYDPSHYQRTPGHYTSKAEQAEGAMKSGAVFSTGRTGAFSSTGAAITNNVTGSYGVAPVAVTNGTGCLPCQQNRGLVVSQPVMYNTNTVYSTTQGYPGTGSVCYPNQPLSARYGGVRESRSTVTVQNLPHLPTARTATWGSTDLWTARTKPHTGTYEGLACGGSARYTTSAPVEDHHHHDDHHHDHDHDHDHAPAIPGQPKKACCSECKTGAAPCASTRTSGAVAPFSPTGGMTTTTTTSSYSFNTAEPWRYDHGGVAQTKNVELSRNTDPRNKYHIPGYAGYVRGMNFTHGETYAKTTRNCLDVAIDHPHDQAW